MIFIQLGKIINTVNAPFRILLCILLIRCMLGSIQRDLPQLKQILALGKFSDPQCVQNLVDDLSFACAKPNELLSL